MKDLSVYLKAFVILVLTFTIAAVFSSGFYYRKLRPIQRGINQTTEVPL